MIAEMVVAVNVQQIVAENAQEDVAVAVVPVDVKVVVHNFAMAAV